MGSMVAPASLSSLMPGEMVVAIEIKQISTPALIMIAAILAITHMSQNLISVLRFRGIGRSVLSMNELLSLFYYIIIKSLRNRASTLEV
jgi:hypothetical protein